MSAHDHAGGLPLGGLARVAVREHRIIYPAVVDVQDGGLIGANCARHLRIVDPVSAVAYYVPIPQHLAGKLAGDLQQNG